MRISIDCQFKLHEMKIWVALKCNVAISYKKEWNQRNKVKVRTFTKVSTFFSTSSSIKNKSKRARNLYVWLINVSQRITVEGRILKRWERERKRHGDKSMLIHWCLERTSKRVGSSGITRSFPPLLSLPWKTNVRKDFVKSLITNEINNLYRPLNLTSFQEILKINLSMIVAMFSILFFSSRQSFSQTNSFSFPLPSSSLKYT